MFVPYLCLIWHFGVWRLITFGVAYSGVDVFVPKEDGVVGSIAYPVRITLLLGSSHPG